MQGRVSRLTCRLYRILHGERASSRFATRTGFLSPSCSGPKQSEGSILKRLIIGISGASGVIYGIRMLEMLKAAGDIETHLVMSKYARLNIEIETDYTPREVEDLADVVYSVSNQAASISSGSFRTEGMVSAPCSMKTLSGIAPSSADSLLVRAADVVLKEQRRLVLMA